MLVGLALLLPTRRIRVVAAVVGLVLGLLAVVRMLDLGFHEVLHRPFNPVNDWRLVPPAVGMLGDSFGPGWADVAVVGAVVVLVGVPAVVALSVIRICRVAARHRVGSARTVGALGVVWLVCVVLGVQLARGCRWRPAARPRSPSSTSGTPSTTCGDLSVFREELAADDPWSAVPAADLLTGLRGKDVILVFVESYGRVAVEGSSFSADIRDLLDAGTQSLADAGFSARSGFLTSSTFGGISWLAHATLHSGLWIDTQQRHDQLLPSDRFTLPAAFERAGWRTVVDVPSNRDPWPEGRAFYRFDEDYDRHRRRVRGPEVQLRGGPGPVHAGGLRAPGAGTGSRAGDGGDRPGVVARAVDAAAAHARLGRGGRRIGLRRHAGRGSGAHRRGGGHRPGQGAVRGVDRVRAHGGALVRDDAPPARRGPGGRPGSATTSPPRSSPGPTPRTTSRSRSSPPTRRCWRRRRPGAGTTGCCPARMRRYGGWTRSGTGS